MVLFERHIIIRNHKILKYNNKIVPLMWVNCAQGQSAYDLLEHYLRDEHFEGAKLQSLSTAA